MKIHSDLVEFQNMPDKSNLLKLAITNEQEDRTMTNYSQRDKQVESTSTLQAAMAVEQTTLKDQRIRTRPNPRQAIFLLTETNRYPLQKNCCPV